MHAEHSLVPLSPRDLLIHCTSPASSLQVCPILIVRLLIKETLLYPGAIKTHLIAKRCACVLHRNKDLDYIEQNIAALQAQLLLPLMITVLL